MPAPRDELTDLLADTLSDLAKLICIAVICALFMIVAVAAGGA